MVGGVAFDLPKPISDLRRHLKQIPQFLIVNLRHLVSRTEHQFMKDCKRGFLIKRRSNQNQRRQVIHALTVATADGILLGKSHQNVEKRIFAAVSRGLELGQLEFAKGTRNIKCDLFVILFVRSRKFGKVKCKD